MSGAVTLAGYALVVVAAAGLEVLRARRGSLTLGRLFGHITAERPGRLLLLLVWGFAGWHFFVRR